MTRQPNSAARTIRLLAMREIRERALTRSFAISSLITVLAIVALIVVPQILSDDGPTELTLGAVGDDAAALAEAAARIAPTLNAEVTVEAITDREAAEAALTDDGVDGVLVDGPSLLVAEEPDDTLQQLVTAAAQQHALVDRLAARGLSPEEAAAALSAEVEVAVERLEGEAGDDEAGDAFAFVGIVLMFMFVVTYAGYVLTGTIEEKSSRVVEVLLGSARPWHLLTGKLIGLGALALSQFLLTVAAGLTTLIVTDSDLLPPTSVESVAMAVVWFVLGFLFYATIYAVAASMASSMEDAQSTAGPIGMLLTAAYLISVLVVGPNPEGIWARVLSLLPPFAPMTMPARQAQGAVASWEIAVSAVLMLVATYAVIRLAGRLYTEAILRTGRKLKWVELWRTRDLTAVEG